MYKFSTEDLITAQACLLVYGVYRSRDKSSALNGVDTWTRCKTFAQAALIQSADTASFATRFCKKSGVTSLKPKYFDTGEPVPMADGTLVKVDGFYNFHPEIFGGTAVRRKIEDDLDLIIWLVRERIQSEKVMPEFNAENGEGE